MTLAIRNKNPNAKKMSATRKAGGIPLMGSVKYTWIQDLQNAD